MFSYREETIKATFQNCMILKMGINFFWDCQPQILSTHHSLPVDVRTIWKSNLTGNHSEADKRFTLPNNFDAHLFSVNIAICEEKTASFLKQSLLWCSALLHLLDCTFDFF